MCFIKYKKKHSSFNLFKGNIKKPTTNAKLIYALYVLNHILSTRFIANYVFFSRRKSMKIMNVQSLFGNLMYKKAI